MPHDYFCTECGKRNSNETVLFDMDMLLTQDEKGHLKLIHFYLTLSELMSLLNKGEPLEGAERKCTLSFSELMVFLSQCMDVPELTKLTLEEAHSFAYPSEDRLAPGGHGADEIAEDDPFAKLNDMGDTPGIAAAPQSAPEEHGLQPYARAIRALQDSISANQEEAIAEEQLRQEIQKIVDRFGSGSYTFRLAPIYSADDMGTDFVIGYIADGTYVRRARVCVRCRKPIFTDAGTAEHRVISFIGATASGKTSTILALTHYARYGLNPIGNSAEVEIWRRIERSSFSNVTVNLLNEENRKLKSDLEWFTLGIAPKKTDATQRDDAYHATMKIRDGDSKHSIILTFMDLPGELFLVSADEHGNSGVKEEMVEKEFSAALSSAAYVVCVDRDIFGSAGELRMLTDFCCQMQDMQRRKQNQQDYVPTMIVFTKADEQTAQSEQAGSVRELYMLREEEQSIRGSDNYKEYFELIMNQLESDSRMKKSYHAAMRCGAFGHEVFNTGDVLVANQTSNSQVSGPTQLILLPGQGTSSLPYAGEAEKGERGQDIVSTEQKRAWVKKLAKEKAKTPQEMVPTPSQVDLLMKWILWVMGCQPCKASFRTRAMERAEQCPRELNYTVSRVQYRTQNPGPKGPEGNSDIDEAMARCVLFNNPGQWDKALVASLSEEQPRGILSKLIRGTTEWIRKKMSHNPDTNAENGR